jgi:hypothetical protein
MSEIKHKYLASLATKYSLAYNYIREYLVAVTILDIISCPLFHLKHYVTDTAFCPILQVNLLSWTQ